MHFHGSASRSAQDYIGAEGNFLARVLDKRRAVSARSGSKVALFVELPVTGNKLFGCKREQSAAVDGRRRVVEFSSDTERQPCANERGNGHTFAQQVFEGPFGFVEDRLLVKQVIKGIA